MRYCFSYSGARFFPLKIEFTQFPDDFRLNTHQLRRSAMQMLRFNFIFGSKLISPCFTFFFLRNLA